jgi:hypothetical protein
MKQAVHFHLEQTGYERLVNLLHVPVGWLCRPHLGIVREAPDFAGPAGLLAVAASQLLGACVP